jgi:4-hydroxy-2-oxoheptanedioate aldolase
VVGPSLGSRAAWAANKAFERRDPVERNRAKRRLREGGVVCCLAGLDSSDKIDFMGQFGFDAVWLECEHGSLGWSQIADMTRACDLWGMSSILRVNSNQPWLITRYLDQGASGIVVPHINTREEALRAVQSAKFAPLGYRGISGGRQSYGVADYFNKANDETIVMVMIEEMRAVENLDEILSVDNIDVIFVAPGDLAQTMGYLGRMTHPDVQATIDNTLRRIIEAGRCAGATVVGDNARHYLDLGVRFLYVSTTPWLAAGARDFLEQFGART